MARTVNRTEYKVKLLPISERPKCKVCQRPLKPVFFRVGITTEQAEDKTTRIVQRRIFTGHYGYLGNGEFCSYQHLNHFYTSQEESKC